MAEFWGYVHKEWLLVARSRAAIVFAAVLLLYCGFIYNVVSEHIHVGDMMNVIAFIVPAPFTIWGTALGARIVHRDRADGFAAFLGSLPVHPLMILSARLVVLLIIFLIITLVPVVFWLIHALAVQASWETIAYVSWFLLSTMAPVCCFLFAGVLLGLLIRRNTVYIIAVGVWFLIIYGGYFFELRVSDRWKYMISIFLFNYDQYGYFDSMWGFSHDPMFWLHRGLYLLLALLLLLIVCIRVLWVYNRRVPYGSAALAMIIGVAVIAGATVFVSEQRARVQQYENAIPAYAGTSDTVRLESYDVRMRYGEEGHLHIQMTATVTLGQGEEWVLGLNRLFEIESVTIDGHSAQWRRSGDRLQLSGPVRPTDLSDSSAASFRLEMAYSGQIDQWKIERPYQQTTIITPDHTATKHRLYLTSALVWLPSAGRNTLADYRLTIDYPTGIRIYSNLSEVNRREEGGRQIIAYHGEGVTGVQVIGGSLRHFDLESDTFRLRILGGELLREQRIRSYYEPLLQLKSRLSAQLPGKMTKQYMTILQTSGNSEIDPGLLDPGGMIDRDLLPFSTLSAFQKMNLLFTMAEQDLLTYTDMTFEEAAEAAFRLALEVMPREERDTLKIHSLSILSGLPAERVEELLDM